MSQSFDVIVLGLGAMGTSACLSLARRGVRVLGLEQFEIGHDRGSSHGRTRVIRKAYFEDPRYVPLLHATYRLWRELEAATGEKLLHLCGCLNLGPPAHECIRGVLQSVHTHRLPFEQLDAAEVRRRWPILECHNDDIGVYESEAGFVIPERCTRLLADQARAHGAVLRERQAVTRWSATERGVQIETAEGDYEAGQLIVTAGAWLPVLTAELDLPLRIERQVQAWFQPAERDRFTPGRMPVFIHFVEDRGYYGIPDHDGYGVKIARHHGGTITTADRVERGISAEDEKNIRWYLRRYMPAADGAMVDAKVCLYTNTPDDHFIIDYHPRHANVLLAGGFSGHGFKFAPVVGDIVADLATTGRTSHPIEPFSLKRFAALGEQ